MGKSKNNIGLPPGSILYTGSKNSGKVPIYYIQYDTQQLSETEFDNHNEIVLVQASEDNVDWYDIRGIHDTELIEQIGHTFDIHSLILEDVTDVHQRPKFEEYEKGIFIIAKAISFDTEKVKIITEQVAIYLKKGFVVSFQETDSDLFELIRKRVKSDKGRIRKRGADYLAYALIDVIVDNYFVVLEKMEQKIEALEDEVLLSQDSSIRSRIHRLKKELLFMRKSISPLSRTQVQICLFHFLGYFDHYIFRAYNLL